MNTTPTSQFHGSHPRLGNNVHHRQRKDKDPQRLWLMQEEVSRIFTISRLSSGLPHGSVVHHATGDFVVDRSDVAVADNGGALIQPATTADSANSVTL